MFTIDTYTIIFSSVLILLALLSSIVSPFFRKPKHSNTYNKGDVADNNDTIEDNTTSINSTENEKENIVEPPISIILTPNDDALALSKNLNKYLNQEYKEYEIIVVAPKGDVETEDILKTYSNNPRLYVTFIPSTSKYMSRKKLAITLGAKAAKYKWLLICDIFCAPQSEYWLSTLARNCKENVNIVAGFTNYDDDAPDFWRFEHFYMSCYLMREAQKGIAYAWNSNALLFKKDEFLAEEGFRGNLKFVRGEFDFIVNKYAKKGSTVIENSEDGTLIEETPTYKHWTNKHLYYLEDRKHLKRSAKHRIPFYIDQLAVYINYLFIIVALLYSIYTSNWIICIAAVFSLIATIALRIFIGNKALALFNIDIPSWKIIPYELRIIWQNLNYRIKYWRANKYDFISHKL
jgi:hypothetical protein